MIRVAITDDNPKVLVSLRNLLSLSRDINIVSEIHNGQEAVDCAKRIQPDIIVMDVHMPVLDGFDATRQISDLPVSTRIILISLDVESGAAQKAEAVGAQGFIPKEDVKERLLPAIRNVYLGKTVFV